jgi:penicillin-binding protein 1B
VRGLAIATWAELAKLWSSRRGRILVVGAGLAVVIPLGVLTYYYVRFSRMIDEIEGGYLYQTTSRIFTAPRRIAVGEVMSPAQLRSFLQAAGYGESAAPDAPGIFRSSGGAIEIYPSPHSYFGGRNSLRVEFGGPRISRIRSLETKSVLSVAEIEPELLTNLFDRSREKRRLVRFSDLPDVLVKSVLAAEDKRFFDHPGFDPIRIFGAAWADVRRGSKAQGASTITMQVARSFFFTTRREWGRKLAETYMALLLEHRFTKQEIFELYANQIYLGNRGSFAIHGFGEGSQAYLGKDIRELNLGEAAFLAGIIRAPNRYSSVERKPERAIEARDRVLAVLVESQTIKPELAEAAKKNPLPLVNARLETNLSGYFVDMVKDDLLDRFSEEQLNSQSHRIYVTLDAALQRAAVDAVEAGMKSVDAQLAKRNARLRKKGEDVPLPQVAFVALDPRTGAIKALVGGRDYGKSQLNHVLARRQPGSVFKPFVYAAALASGVDGSQPLITPATTVVDEPTTFFFNGEEYTPDNYGQDFYGNVTIRDALTRSLNVATVKVAEMVGFQRVAQIARGLGLDASIQPTPAMALGAYEMTPLEVAAGYTVFAGGGTRAEPMSISRVVGPTGLLLEESAPSARAVLDKKVAYLVTNLLEDVINRGTGAGVRTRGFRAPAAGKTGTSHDGWFAGYTSNLLCVTWIGFDDNRQLGLSGAASAAPIWTEFMKRAVLVPGFRDAKPFAAPEGIVSVAIDPQTQQLSTGSCPDQYDEVFVSGTEPTEPCSLHGGQGLPETSSGKGNRKSLLRRIFGFMAGKNKEEEKPMQVPSDGRSP